MLILMTITIVGILNATGIVGLDSLKSLLSSEKAQATEEPITPPSEEQPPTSSDSPTSPPTTATEELLTLPELPLEEPDSPEPSAEEPANQETTPPKLPDGQDYREGQTPLPAGLGAQSSKPRAAQDTLESFLSAEDLAGRRPFLSAESATNPELATTLLAQPIPKPINIHYLERLNDEQEKRTDYFYAVSWDGEGRTPAKPIMVELHKWGETESPSVHSEAFLQFYEQKLASYAAAPQEHPARFFLFAKCVSKCFEPTEVHDHASKATLKLASFPNDRHPVKAYFDKKGEIYEKLVAYSNGLAFRKEIPLTATLEWSNPDLQPRYLEVRIINSFDWHP